MSLPNLPPQGANPWFNQRQAFDEGVRDLLEPTDDRVFKEDGTLPAKAEEHVQNLINAAASPLGRSLVRAATAASARDLIGLSGGGNLFNPATVESGTLSPSGNINPHATNVTSDWIPVVGGEPYMSGRPDLYRIVWFTDARAAISGTDTDYVEGSTAWTAPSGAAWVRIGVAVSSHAPDIDMVFNHGVTLWDPEAPTETTGFWDGSGFSPVTIDKLAFAAGGKIPATYLALPVQGDRLAHEAVDGAVPPKLELRNLWDDDEATAETISPSGNVTAHDTNRLSPHIPVTPGSTYSFQVEAPSMSRIVWFTTADTVISGTDTSWMPGGTHYTWTAPATAATARIVIGTAAIWGPGQTVFNDGTTLADPHVPAVIPSGFWDTRELPPTSGEGIDPEQLTETVRGEVTAAVGHIEPSTPTLQLATTYTGRATPYWLSDDGQVLYGQGDSSRLLVQSTDEWATHTVIADLDFFIQAVRTLADGELLVAIARDNAVGRLAKLWRSTGYSRETPTATTWTEVLETPATEANINNSWGLQVYDNVVIASEYGLRGETGGRRVWMSEDHAQTFRLVFDQKTVDAPGRPPWNEQGHVHTSAWDPYWQRLWVAVGDGPNTAVYYSDDKGATWQFVEDSNVVQYTGIMPLPDVVLFGSDRQPNGLYTYRRGHKADRPKIEPLLILNDVGSLTHVFQLPYRRGWDPAMPTYFPATPATGTAESIIAATVDGKKGHLMWQGVTRDAGGALSGEVRTVLGPTAQGNVLAVMHVDPTITGVRVLKAPAPTWARL